MQAIIMAGGKGTRLMPLTGNIPKLLLPLHNGTLLDHIIGHVKNNGCDNVIICIGHLGEKIKEYIDRKAYGIKIMLSIEREPAGTAGALHLIKNHLEDEYFLLYGDVYSTINLKQMLQFHRQKKADATLALHISDHPHDSTVVTINRNRRLLQFVEKPNEQWKKFGNLTTTPLYILKKEMVHFISESKPVDIARDIFPMMIKENKKIFGYVTEEYAKDLGTPERYRTVLQFLKK